MTFIETVPEGEATGAVAAMYDTDREVFGYLPNFTRGFSARPDVYAAWRQLNGAVKANMDLRRYELATVAAAVTQDDVDRLRAHGLTDAEITDVVLAAAVRSFFSKALDGLGMEPDAQLSER